MLKKIGVGGSRAIIVFVSLLLTFLWFRSGLIMGSAESGLPFYDLSKYAEISRWAWAYPGLGNSLGIHAAGYPTYLVLSFFQKWGVSGFLIESFVFFLVLVVAGVSTLELSRLFFPEIKTRHALIGALFYLFNPFFLVNVWNRFLYDYIFFMALLPLAVLVYLNGLFKKKISMVLVFGVVTGLFSYTLASLPFNLILFLVIVYSSAFFFILGNKKDRLFICIYFLACSLSYLLINIWWISQLFSFVASSGFSASINNYFSLQSNLSDLSVLSERLGNFIYTTRFLHSTAVSDVYSPIWLRIFNMFPINIIEYVITFLIFWVIYKKKNFKNVLFLGSLFLLSLFLVKGVQPPFGEIFRWFFENIAALQIYRNPFEKFGFLLVFSTAPLFAFSIDELLKVVNKNVFYLVAGLLSLFILVIWGFPYWSGYLFSMTVNNKTSGYSVSVPEYYKKLEQWLGDQKGNFRFVSLPMGQEGITYDWRYPYSGVEILTDLIRTPGISYITTVPYYESVARSMEQSLIQKKSFQKILDIVNIRYILLRKDIDWRLRSMRNPVEIEKALLENVSFYKVLNLGEVSLWENPNWKDREIYVTANLAESVPLPSINDLNLLDLTSNTTLYTGPLSNASSRIVLHPSDSYYINYLPSTTFDENQQIFPSIRFLPSSPFYTLSVIIEKLETSFYPKDIVELANMQVSFLGKRLNEARISNNSHDSLSVSKSMSYYRLQLLDFQKTILKLGIYSPSLISTSQLDKDGLYNKFIKHASLLSQISQSTDDKKIKTDVNKTLSSLKQVLINSGIFPMFDYVSAENFPVNERALYHFDVPFDGVYQFAIDSAGWQTFYALPKNNIFDLQIDNEVKSLYGSFSKNGTLSFGGVRLAKGIHEIGINSPQENNLVNIDPSVELSVDHGSKELILPIKDYDPYSKYSVSFTYRVIKGAGFIFSVQNDNDVVQNGNSQDVFKKLYGPDTYNFDFQGTPFTIGPYPGSTTAAIKIKVIPWNDCKTLYFTNQSACEDNDFASRYDRTTDLIIKNLEVKRVLTDNAYLILNNDKNTVENNTPFISYNKVNPTKYTVYVNGAVAPFNLILSELYDSGWQAVFSDGTRIMPEKHFLANAFANGWQVERRGEYTITLEYAPQNILDKTRIISFISFVTSLVVLVVIWLKNKYVK